MAFDIPALNDFRSSVGLPKKDFHITLGFEGGDIHMAIDGKDEKGKNKMSLISKKADPKYDKYLEEMPEIKFSSLGGQEKQSPKGK